MKKKSFFISSLLLFIPAISIGAELRPLDVQFAFTAPDSSTKQLSGYRLYMEGQKVCETNDPSTSRITCNISTEEDTGYFTLTAYYSNGTESPPSPSFAFTFGSQPIDPTPLPPTAVMSTSTTAGKAPLNVSFDGTLSTDPDSSIASYRWEFGDGTQATGPIASHVYTTPGTFYAQLTVVDDQGLSSSATTPIVVAEAPPTAVMSTSTAAGEAPLSVSFDGTLSTDPDSSIASYRWEFGDGTQATGPTASHIYTTPGTFYAQLTVVDDQGLSDSATTPIVVTEAPPTDGGGTTDPDPGDGGSTDPDPTPSPDDFSFEVGSLSINEKWVRVHFENSYQAPIVIAGPPTDNGVDPSLVRIRNVDTEGFDIRLQEWDYLDGYHTDETVSYMVVEKGVYTLANGLKLEAGSFDGTTSLKQVSLQQPYDLTPVLMTQVMTENKANAVTNRLREIGKNSFKHKLQGEEKNQTAHNGVETIGYIAMEPGTAQVGNVLFESSLTPQEVDHNWFALTYEGDFSSMPFFFAGMQTTNGNDTAAMRMSTTSSQTGTQIKVEEEQSNDAEITHAQETIGYFTIGRATDSGGSTDPDPNPPTNNFNFEVGSLDINHNWVRVQFENTYNQPIVIAGPPTFNGGDPSVVRISNVNEEGFDIRLQEWDYLDGFHSNETVSYMVVEKGVYTLTNGTKIEAGSFDGSTSLNQVSLQQAYDLSPVIMTQVMTENEANAVTNRLREIGKNSFKHKLQGQESTQTAHNGVETIGYIAMEPGIEQVGNILFESSLTPQEVDHNWLSLIFEGDFSSEPFFFAGMQTTNGNDTAAVRIMSSPTQTGTQIKVEEEQSKNSETAHGKEVMGYFTIGAAN